MSLIDPEWDKLMSEQTELRMQFSQDLDELLYLSEDFSEEAQQRWIETLRSVSELREQIWSNMKAIEKLQAEYEERNSKQEG